MGGAPPIGIAPNAEGIVLNVMSKAGSVVIRFPRTILSS